MIGYVGIYVADLQKSDKFYCPLFKTLGYRVLFSLPECIAYGLEGIPIFEIYTGKPQSAAIYIAFQVQSKEIIEAFDSTGLALGGRDNGKPEYRDYSLNYYAAFIIDPNGHNLEAVLL